MLDFFIKHEKMEFLDAYHKILDLMDAKEPVIVPINKKQKYDFFFLKKLSITIYQSITW